MRVGLVQLSSSDDPAKNLPQILAYIRKAASAGAEFILTPEVSNCVSQSRERQRSVLSHGADDPTLVAIRAEAKTLGVWVLIGSLGLLTDDDDGRFANRSYLISTKGDIAAHYDKIHMFDVQVTKTETFRESEGYRPGNRAVVADAGFAKIGMTICYDVRFPHLYRNLAQAGAQILTVPAAFSPVTGVAHWETLLRARAIETGCFVLAPAQSGSHVVTMGKPRDTWGHSLAVSPWGEILTDAGVEPGITIIDLNLSEVDAARIRLPSLDNDRPYEGP
ncbi:MAG: carbon-nitrogen hydrolase family protein [Paracoccaceae bacterium]